MMRAEYSSNTKSAPGRLFVLVIDSGNMTRGGGRGAMEAAGQFVQKLAPNDLVAVVSLPAGVTVDFTADRLAIKNALIKVVGGGALRYLSNTNVSLGEAFSLVTGSQKRLWDEAVRMECNWARSDSEYENCRSTLEADARNKFQAARISAESSERAFEILIRRLAGIEGQKHLIFIGEALVTGSSFGYLDGVADLKWLGGLAQAARVNLYVLHLDRAFLEAFDVRERFPSRTPFEDARLLNDGLGEIAGQAGGAYFNLTTALDPTFERIARETSAWYVVTFEPTDDDRDGKPHSVGVKVAKPDVTIRARKQFSVDPAVRTAPVAARLSRALNSPYLPVVGPNGPDDVRRRRAPGRGASCAPGRRDRVRRAGRGGVRRGPYRDRCGRERTGIGGGASRGHRASSRRGPVRLLHVGVRREGGRVRRPGGGHGRPEPGRRSRAPRGRPADASRAPRAQQPGADRPGGEGGRQDEARRGRACRRAPASRPTSKCSACSRSAGAAADRPEVQFEVARTEDGPALVGSVPPVADETGSAAWYAEGTINLASLAPGPMSCGR